MACRFQYYNNGVKRKLYEELYHYMDNTIPEEKTTESVYKILRANGIAVRSRGDIYLNQANVEHSLLEIDRINTEYPGLLNTQYIKMTPETAYSKAAPLHVLNINEYILQQIPTRSLETADFISDDQTEIDQYVRLVAGKENTDDYYLSEKARQENVSDQSRFSDMEKEDVERLEKVVVHLKESFATAGVTVDVEYDTELDVIADVKPGEVNPIVTINPNKVKKDTAYHEFGHIYIDMLGVNDPIVSAAIEQLKNSYLYKQVQERYPELTGERLDKEVLATAIGIEGAKIVRKNPTPLQQLINRIMRAFGKLFGIKPNAAAIIAEEMFAKKLRAEKMLNPLSPYAQQSKDQQNFTEIIQNLKVRISSEIYETEQLPTQEREKTIYRLQRLKEGLDKVNRIEDLVKFVDAMGDSLAAAYTEYERIMDLPLEERASLENMNSMYKIKTELDALNVMQSIKRVMLVKEKEGKILDQGNFDTMEARVQSILNTALVLDKKFSDDIIPIMAQSLVGYHNKSLDPQLQAQIDNARRYKRTQGLDTSTIEYKELQKRHKDGDLTNKQFLDEKVKLKVEQLKNKMIPNYGAIVKQLRAAHKDKSAFSYWLDPLIYSSDTTIQLFVKAVQDAELRKNDMTRIFKSQLSNQYEKFTAGMSDFDIAALNDDLLEEVTIRGMKRLAIVNPIDQDKYNNDKKAFIRELNIKYGQPTRKEGQTKEDFNANYAAWILSNNYKKVRAEEAKWDKKNSEPIDTWRAELKILREKIKNSRKKRAKLKAQDKQDSDAYMMETMKLKELISFKSHNYDTASDSPRRDWVRPKKDIYTNSKYTKIQNTPRLKEYYDFILEEFQKAHKMIGVNRMDKNPWDEFTYLMPSYRKEEIDRAKEQGVYTALKDKLKDTFTITETNDEYSTYDQNSGDINKRVPVYGVNRVESKHISKDIGSSLYRFRHMAHNYQAKSELVGQVMLFRDIIKEQDTLFTNAGGIEYIQKTAESMGFKLPLLKEGESYKFKHIDEWIDMVMYGEYELKQNFNILNQEISGTRLVGALNTFTAINALAFNMLQGTNQVILDNLSMMQESVAGEFMSKSNLAWAKAKYWGEGAAISDLGRFDPKTKLGKALEYFDALTEFTDHEGNKLVGSRLRKAFDTGNLLFVQQAAEHELSTTRMLGLMDSLKGKLKDSNGNVIKNEKGEDANLYDLLVIDKDGVMSVDPRVDNFNRLDFIGLIQGLSRRTNQTKGKMHSSMLSRRAHGKLVMLFRSWLLPGLRRRYGHGGFTGSTIHVDEELGAVTQGMYISFWNMMTESVSNVTLPWTTYGKMTDMEKQNVKRSLVEFSAMIAAGVLVNALAGLDDDDENWAVNFTLYQAKRYQTEILQWTPGVGLKEAWRIMRSPTATVRPVEDAIDLIDQVFFKEVPHLIGVDIDPKKIYYQRRTGRFEKGDRKIRKKFEDLMPVWRGWTRTKTPGEAYKWFTTLD